MIKLATSLKDVTDAINKFPSEVKQSQELQERLAYARAWYAIRNKHGEWVFGPSKFVGYKELTAEKYLDSNVKLDGRKTEVHLSEWFCEMTDDLDPLWDELSDFLAEFGKIPSRMARINILDQYRDSHIINQEGGGQFDKVVELIIEVSKILPAQQLRDLKKRLAT